MPGLLLLKLETQVVKLLVVPNLVPLLRVPRRGHGSVTFDFRVQLFQLFFVGLEFKVDGFGD